jgi:putative inorganic carbon (hco3(-)) transporter
MQERIKEPPENNSFLMNALGITLSLLGGGLSAGIIIVLNRYMNPFVVLALMVGIVVLASTIQSLDSGLVVLVFMIYTYFSDVAYHTYGIPSLLNPFVLFLIGLVLVRWLLTQNQPQGWQRAAVVTGMYGVVLFSSLLYADSFELAWSTFIDYYLKNAILVILISVLLTNKESYRSVAWTLIAGALFLGTISVVQYVTGTHDFNYFGFSVAREMNIIDDIGGIRQSGPFGAPNTFAQIMVVILPLAMDRFWNENNPYHRYIALFAAVIIFFTVIFTFSRSGFLALLLVIGLIALRHPPKPVLIILTLVGLVIILQFLPTNYLARMETIIDSIPGLGDRDIRSESSLRSRATDMAVAWRMFLDHPILGVGYDNYTVHYLDYARQIGLSLRGRIESAHSLFLEILAETGLLGITAFGFVLYTMFNTARRASKVFIQAGLPNYASLVNAYSVGMLGYLTVSIFLHDTYPRYFWVFFGIIISSLHVAQNALQKTKKPYIIEQNHPKVSPIKK